MSNSVNLPFINVLSTDRNTWTRRLAVTNVNVVHENVRWQWEGRHSGPTRTAENVARAGGRKARSVFHLSVSKSEPAHTVFRSRSVPFGRRDMICVRCRRNGRPSPGQYAGACSNAAACHRTCTGCCSTRTKAYGGSEHNRHGCTRSVPSSLNR